MKGRFLVLAASFLIIGGIGMVALSLTDIYAQGKKTDQSLEEARERVGLENNSKNEDVLQEEQIINPSFSKGEVIGVLKIPRLEAELPIIEGTDEDELEKGVGHYSTTAFPGQPDQILLSGHRDTVFRRLGELEVGDIFQVVMPYGEFTYVIKDSKIVDANDTTVIKSTAPTETLTVSTCYPFSYIGDAPDRYILNAHRTDVPPSN